MSRNYHGYGPDGYRPGPFHGRLTNRDHGEFARQQREDRVGRPMTHEEAVAIRAKRAERR